MKPNSVVPGINVTFDIFATVDVDVNNGFVEIDFVNAEDANNFLSKSFDLPSVIKAKGTIDGLYTMPLQLSTLPEEYYISIPFFRRQMM
ncbi:33929_t:CDS:1, partial [Racocetra persica]